MNANTLKWVFLFSLALLWGSSFILIKKGLVGLSPLQLTCLRVLITGIFLGLIGFKKIKQIWKWQWKWIAVSGFIGTMFPTLLFSYAETEIDSAIASILNSTVPLLALVTGILFFSNRFIKKQFIGVVIGLIGSVLLILAGASLNPNQNYWFAVLPVIASLMYAFNANIIKSYLEKISALGIATGSFLVLIPFALGTLAFTGFFNAEFLARDAVQTSLLYVTVLALFGTALAKIIFNRLIQLSNPVFSTSVTYLIPVVALFWGYLDGEEFNLFQLAAGGVILLGVYISNRKKKEKKAEALEEA
ncbi:DMT family transporter [Psychroflexus sediminis]|uniref:Permease of the drug/metabolite transporter (DMT) superfamily n=1 Tax=Psychroflexus sediminis TaxID=470826 RepID=A0A1G7Z8X0_9FLAO|nr:EamA family transporter [Psychroflexus sediminis]SDH04966.1 Permease of the drug/metabolite transporter (DMT) superfamily [Psychroflexus sediminis]